MEMEVSASPQHASLDAARLTRSASFRTAIVILLDVIITIYGTAVIAILTLGGIDLGVVSVRNIAKPILVLLIVLPIRITLGGASRLLEISRRANVRSPVSIRTLVLDRVPPVVTDVAFALLATRLASLFVGFIANLLFVAPSAGRPFAMPFRSRKFVEVFAAWDSGWYFDIARQGYYFTPNGQSSIAFFPLYPLLMRAAAWPFGSTDKALWMAGIVISCGAFALALATVHRLTQKVTGDREAARRAVLYMAVFPFSLFFTRVYAESLFLLLTALAVSRAYDGRWVLAGLCGALATVTRPNGILIALPLAFMAVSGRPRPRDVTKRLVALAPIPAALAAYCAYTYTLAGEPLAWLSAQAHWGYSLGHPPWEQLVRMIERFVKHGFYDYFFVSAMAPYRLFHGVVALIFLALTPAVFKNLGVGMGAYVLASLLVPLSGNALEGVGRYAAVLFPTFMLAGNVKSRRVHEAILITAALFLALFVGLFATNRPIY
jgi:Gpi18-like mannosyltransferase